MAHNKITNLRQFYPTAQQSNDRITDFCTSMEFKYTPHCESLINSVEMSFHIADGALVDTSRDIFPGDVCYLRGRFQNICAPLSSAWT